MPQDDRRSLGHDIGLVEFGWPVGMPLCRSLGGGLWEVRSDLASNRTARVIFCTANGRMVLLHGFIKRTQKTPQTDLALARKRQKEIEQSILLRFSRPQCRLSDARQTIWPFVGPCP
jgi:phage-related protein